LVAKGGTLLSIVLYSYLVSFPLSTVAVSDAQPESFIKRCLIYKITAKAELQHVDHLLLDNGQRNSDISYKGEKHIVPYY
jgi:hypothetical protein